MIDMLVIKSKMMATMAMLMLVLRMVLGSVFLGNSGAVVDVA